MGYAHYALTRNGEEIEAGYAVEATCEEDGCDTKIDRGLYYLCGGMPGNEHGCGGYFCDEHMFIPVKGDAQQLCGPCLEKLDATETTDA